MFPLNNNDLREFSRCYVTPSPSPDNIFMKSEEGGGLGQLFWKRPGNMGSRKGAVGESKMVAEGEERNNFSKCLES